MFAPCYNEDGYYECNTKQKVQRDKKLIVIAFFWEWYYFYFGWFSIFGDSEYMESLLDSYETVYKIKCLYIFDILYISSIL